MIFIRVINPATGKLVGLKIDSWWKRFGKGSFPDSLREVGASVEPWAHRAA